MVTLGEFQKFKPDIEVRPETAAYPALMSQQEASDYVTFLGKRLGVDFIWRPAPPTVNRKDADKGKGYLFVASQEVFEDAGTPPAAGTPTPPPNMVYVPEGPFVMGSDSGDPDEAPKHSGTAGPIFIDKYEVSNGEFKAAFPEFQFKPGRENFPAIVTWKQAAAYAEKVGKRLPTEAEWEKAARGTDGRTFPWGETYDPSFVAWDENAPRGGAPARPESPYGCLDMAGGAWEWTADWYKPYADTTAPSEQYGETYKVIRGGGNFNDIAMMRTTARYYLAPDTTGHMYVGFRCVKDAK
jgi:formylglycine-generating enzyme required for sulfatase activity